MQDGTGQASEGRALSPWHLGEHPEASQTLLLGQHPRQAQAQQGGCLTFSGSGARAVGTVGAEAEPEQPRQPEVVHKSPSRTLFTVEAVHLHPT